MVLCFCYIKGTESVILIYEIIHTEALEDSLSLYRLSFTSLHAFLHCCSFFELGFLISTIVTSHKHQIIQVILCNKITLYFYILSLYWNIITFNMKLVELAISIWFLKPWTKLPWAINSKSLFVLFGYGTSSVLPSPLVQPHHNHHGCAWLCDIPLPLPNCQNYDGEHQSPHKEWCCCCYTGLLFGLDLLFLSCI